MIGVRHSGICIAIVAMLTGLSQARAQMQLPGATNGVASPAAKSGASSGEAGGGEPRVVRPIVMKPPSEDTIIGHMLSLDGAKGKMMFDRAGADVALTKLTLVGEKISKPGQTCTIDVSLATPIIATDAGRAEGAARLDVAVAACPFSVEVLDGAVLVSRPEPSCDFVAADCRITPGGLWGPPAAEIGLKQIKDLEHQRVRVEATMRANFHALLAQAGKDRAVVKAIAKEQAAFSSDREMICRDYQQESVHGYCSTRITEARALALVAKFAPAGASAHKHATRVKRITKPALPAPEVEPETTSDARPR